MKQLWYPKASRAQTFDSRFPGMVGSRIDGVVLHTTEGVGWPSYAGGASAPNMTIHFDHEKKQVYYRQHFQANRSARALAGSVNGISTNRNHVFQIEIIGTSGWATTRNRYRTYTLAEKWYVPGYPDWALQGIADVLKWLNVEWAVPLSSPYVFVSWANDSRMSNNQWLAFKGVTGHQHVPRNDHTDPGQINIERILELAKGKPNVVKPVVKPSPAKPISKPAVKGPFDMFNNIEEFKKATKEAFTEYIRSTSGSVDIARAANSTGTWGDIDNDGIPDRPIDIQIKASRDAASALAEVRALREDLMASGVIKEQKN